jgi:hypothetical protein
MALTLSRRLIAPLEGLALVQQLAGTFPIGLGPYKRYKRYRELVGWTLSFGSGVRAVRPSGLRVAVVEEADSTLRRNSGSTL